MSRSPSVPDRSHDGEQEYAARRRLQLEDAVHREAQGDHGEQHAGYPRASVDDQRGGDLSAQGGQATLDFGEVTHEQEGSQFAVCGSRSAPVERRRAFATLRL